MRFLVKLLVTMFVAMPLCSGIAAADDSTTGTSGPATTGDVQQKDYPCAIVLCLANPKGPMAEEKCKPPVRWLITNFVDKAKPWPACLNQDGSAIAQYQSQQHIECPSGFTAEQASTEYGGMVFTGVCLRAVPTCAVRGANAYSPSIAGAACYTVQVEGNYNDHYMQSTTVSVEAVIPASGVTSYAMTLTGGNRESFFFNLGGGSNNLAASIIYRNNNANTSYSGGDGG